MAIQNIMEDVIREKLNEVLKNSECCKCEKCYQDILAISLNFCKPKYVNTMQGELIVKANSMETQNVVDVDIAILKAIETVKQHPHHDINANK